jgi:hypothetical protein
MTACTRLMAAITPSFELEALREVEFFNQDMVFSVIP